MATGRIGVTPVLRTRWSDQPTAGTTSLSGLDDNSVALVYDAGYEAVYRNGVLLSRGNDYTATNGTTITLIDATLAGDIIEVFANDLVPLTDAISKGQYNAKGALLSASAASTPAVLAVGTNNQVLTADSAEATGLKWATPAAPATGANWTLLNAGGTALTGAQTVTVSGISGKDKIMVIISGGSSDSAQRAIGVRLNAQTGTIYYRWGPNISNNASYSAGVFDADSQNAAYVQIATMTDTVSSVVNGAVTFTGCNSSGVKQFTSVGGCTPAGSNSGLHASYQGYVDLSATITSISVFASAGNLDAGTVYVYTSA